MGTKSKAGVVYEYRCQCGMVYVGETGRTLITREMDHRRAIAKGNQDHSGISKHVLETGHEILWDEVRIACHERNWRKRKIKEVSASCMFLVNLEFFIFAIFNTKPVTTFTVY